MILDIIITKKSRFYLKYLLIFILIVLIIFVLLNNYKKIYKKKEGFSSTSGTVTDTSGINFTTGRFIVSSEDLKNEIDRLKDISNEIDGDNSTNLNNYINDLIIIENKFNDSIDSAGETNKGYLTQIQNIQNDINNKLREYLNEDRFQIIDDSETGKEYIGIVSEDIIDSSCKTNRGDNKFNKCKSVCQQTCIDNDMCYGYNYTTDSDTSDSDNNDSCELVISKREKNDTEITELSNTKFFKKINANPHNWNYTRHNRKSANPNVVPMDSITLSDSQNILICSNKCDQYNDVRDKYCLSFTYGIMANEDSSNSDNFVKGCKLYSNVFKRDYGDTGNIIDNDANNLYVRRYHSLANTSEELGVMTNYENPNPPIRIGKIKLIEKNGDTQLPFKYNNYIYKDDFENNNNNFIGSDKPYDNINLNIIRNSKYTNVNVLKDESSINNILNSTLDYENYLHKDSIINLNIGPIFKMIPRIKKSFSRC